MAMPYTIVNRVPSDPMMKTPVRPAMMRPLPCSALKVSRSRGADALFGRAPDGDAQAEQDGHGHHHLDHRLRLVAQAAEGAPVGSDPADDGVDIAFVGREQHVSHRPWWVVPRVPCGVQRSGLIVADNAAVSCRLGAIDERDSYECLVRSLCVSRPVTPGNEAGAEPWCGSVVDPLHGPVPLLTAGRVRPVFLFSDGLMVAVAHGE